MLRSMHARLGVILRWSCLLTLICSSVLPVAAAQSGGDDAALRKLVEKFFDLYQKRDLEGLMALWSEKSPDFAARKQAFQQAFAANKIHVRNITIRKTDVGNDKATIRAALGIAAEAPETGKTADDASVMNRTFHLLLEGK